MISEPYETDLETADIADLEVLRVPSYMERRTPLIVTLINANLTVVDIQKMLEAGMSMARFSTSHTTMTQKVKLLERLNEAKTFLKAKHGVPDWPCATCLELKTCIVKTGILTYQASRTEKLNLRSKRKLVLPTFEDGKLRIYDKTEIILTSDVSQFDKCNDRQIYLDDPYLASDTKVGMEISISEDEIILVCTAVLNDSEIKCRVVKGGLLDNMAYVCTRSRSRKNRPYLTSKDLVLIDFAVKHEFDMIIVNYSRHPITMTKVKKHISDRSKRPLLVCGICSLEGIRNVDDLIEESDGLVLSREFLTFELPSELQYRMPLIQKLIVGKCILAGKPFYLSGGVCQSSLETGEIIERELSDISHAILDGVTGFILKNCRNTDNVVKVLKETHEICAAVEPFGSVKTDYRKSVTYGIPMPANAAEAAALSCSLVAHQTNARLIIIPTVSGRTAKLIFWLRPSCLVLAVTTKTRTTRILKSYRGCVPILFTGRLKSTWYETVQERVRFAEDYAIANNWIEYKECYVTLEKGTDGCTFCDTVRVWYVTHTKKLIVECDDL